jgi:hypothetical protein
MASRLSFEFPDWLAGRWRIRQVTDTCFFIEVLTGNQHGDPYWALREEVHKEHGWKWSLCAELTKNESE